jgi:hypothetical protein
MTDLRSETPLDEHLHAFPVRLDDRGLVEAVRPQIGELEGVDVAPGSLRFTDLEVAGLADRHVQEVVGYRHDPVERAKGLLDSSRLRLYLGRREDQPDA